MNYIINEDICIKKGMDLPSLLAVLLVKTGVNISKLFNDSNINDSIKKDLSDILNNVDKFTTTSFIIIEEYQKYRNLMVEDWYQNRVSLSKGIWIGEGFENQIAFQVDSISNVNIQEYSTDAGYIVSNGKFEIIKTIEGDE